MILITLFIIVQPYFSPYSGMFSRGALYGILIASSIPALLYITALHFHIHLNHGSSSVYTWPFIVKSFLSLLIILAPFAWIIIRYDVASLPREFDAPSAAIVGFFLFFSIASQFLPSRPQTTDIWAAITTPIYCIPFLYTHIKNVMWDAWCEGLTNIDLDQLDEMSPEIIRKNRQPFYQKKEIIEQFQKTLSCPTYESDYVIEQFISNNESTLNLWKTHNVRGLRILDIGGGDGRFTAKLSKLLYQHEIKISYIKMIDPVDWKNEYQNHISKIDDNLKIDFITKPFNPHDLRLDGPYDLIIASHSLYSYIDNIRADGLSSRKEHIKAAIEPLCTLLNEGGRTIIILSSEHGVSAEFKKTGISALFGETIADITAEQVESLIDSYILSAGTVDNFILFSGLRDKITKGSPIPHLLDDWLSYYLRVDFDKISAYERDWLRDELMNKLVKLDWLSELEIKKAMTSLFDMSSISREVYVLPHKTRVLILHKRVDTQHGI